MYGQLPTKTKQSQRASRGAPHNRTLRIQGELRPLSVSGAGRRKFARQHRYALGAELREGARRVLRLVVRAHLGETLCQTPEQFKAWSQNLGHEGVLTTFYSYGAVGNRRQAEIIGSLAESRRSERPDVAEIAKAVARELRSSGPIG